VSSQIKELGLACCILIFTMHHSERLATEVREVGAQGYVLKSQAARDLVLAIETILDGGTFFGSPQEIKSVAKDETLNGPSPREDLAFGET
jgi:two-component system nitrate/nitrite response regulator NarL